jgi:hypothetical protein
MSLFPQVPEKKKKKKAKLNEVPVLLFRENKEAGVPSNGNLGEEAGAVSQLLACACQLGLKIFILLSPLSVIGTVMLTCIKIKGSWGHSSVVKHLTSMCKALPEFHPQHLKRKKKKTKAFSQRIYS